MLSVVRIIDGAFGGPDYLPTCISFNQRDVAIDQGKKVVVVPWDTGSSTHPLTTVCAEGHS